MFQTIINYYIPKTPLKTPQKKKTLKSHGSKPPTSYAHFESFDPRESHPARPLAAEHSVAPAVVDADDTDVDNYDMRIANIYIYMLIYTYIHIQIDKMYIIYIYIVIYIYIYM